MTQKKTLIVAFLLLSTFSSPLQAARLHISANVQGLPDTAKENVLKRLNTLFTSARTLTTEHAERLFERGEKEVHNGIQPYGYFKAQITKKLIKNNNNWRARYVVTPGPVLKISQLTLIINGDGGNDPTFQTLRKNFPVQKGDAFSADTYHDAKQKIFDLAAERGYLNAKMTDSRITIDMRHYRCTMRIVFNTGKRFKFGATHFSNVPFAEDFLMRFATFNAGAPYNSLQVQSLQQNLVDSNFFTAVQVTPLLQKPKGLSIPVNVNLDAKKMRQYDFGIGYGSDTGARGLLGIEFRHIGDYGQHAKALIRASETHNNAILSYIIPGKNPLTDRHSFDAIVDQQQSNAGRSRSAKLAYSYTTAWGHWKQVLALNLLRERYSLFDRPKTDATLFYPNATWQYLNTDDTLNPTRGLKTTLSILGATKKALSTVDVGQALAQLKWIQPITTSNRFILSGALGYTIINDIHALPLSLQFFAGGIQSIRGYKYNSFGPGRVLRLASIELQQSLTTSLYLSTFYDVGNAGSSFSERLKQSVGVGIGWRSPIGAVEVSVAQALNLPGQPRRVQISIGPEF